MQVSTLTDMTTTNVRASVADVEFELMLTIALVVMVIFLFLRSLSATLIPAVAVPLSLIGTFGVMYILGYSLDNLSLMALTISTGFVVDDAIVMIENITRYIEQGENPLSAALKGAEQIGFTIISLTFSLIAVLIPLLFMGDIVGRLSREFAVASPSGDHPDVRHRLADADPDDGGPATEAQAGIVAGPCFSSFGESLRCRDRLLRTHAQVRASLPDDYAARRGGDAGVDGFHVLQNPQRVLSHSGHRRRFRA